MGRPRSAGRVFYLGRVRWLPSDGEELRAFLEMLAGLDEEREIGRKMRIVKAALVGGLARGQAQAVEMDADTSEALDGMLSGL
jgi:hypothetical protein